MSSIDAKEGCDLATLDIPGAFVRSNMDELLHLRLDGPMPELHVCVNHKNMSSSRAQSL
jgi:hypothetical protein